MTSRGRRGTSHGYIRAWSGDLADELTELPTQLLELPQASRRASPSEWAYDLNTVRRVLHGIRRL